VIAKRNEHLKDYSKRMLFKNLFVRTAAINLSTDTYDIPLMVIFTFPVWFALGITFFGVLIVGVAIGIMAAILDALIAILFEQFPDWH
jgi:hypothetical protein